MALQRSTKSGQSDRGFTLVELLVCLTIIGILISLGLTAVSYIRENARRLGCQNNFHQVAVATQSYCASHRFLPLISGIGLMREFSPQTALLPFLERNVDFESSIRNQQVLHVKNPPFTKLEAGCFQCPSDSVPSGCNIRVNTGSTCTPFRFPAGGGDGPFAQRKSCALEAITDGLSQTCLFSERLKANGRRGRGSSYIIGITSQFLIPSDELVEILRDPSLELGDAIDYTGQQWIAGDFINSWYNHVESPNARTDVLFGAHPGELYFHPSASVAASSYHTGGVNVGFADGSVRFVHNAVEKRAWRAVATIAEGDTERILE